MKKINITDFYTFVLSSLPYPMKILHILSICLFLYGSSSPAQNASFITYYEQSGYKKTPRYTETLDFCKKLADASPIVHYETFGKSPQGRDLPLLIVDSDKNFTPEKVKSSGKVVLLVQACIHPGEPEGKDAGLMLIRDLVINKINVNLLDHVTLLFIPIFNVDGHERFGPYNRINQNGPEEMGWRTTAQNLNLNRDFMKADAPEMQAWLKMYNAWLPDFFIDVHTTDGADYQYVITYGLEIYGNADREQSDWLKSQFVPQMEQHMFKMGFPVFPYVSFRDWHDPRSGLEIRTAPPMLSLGYAAAGNRPGMLIETHMLKPYKSRVESTLELVRYSMQNLNSNHAKIKDLNLKADLATASPEFRKAPFALTYKLSEKDSTMTNFLGFEYTIEKSDLTGGDWFKYSDKPTTMNLPVFSTNAPDEMVLLPEYYLIPPEWSLLTEKMKLHGVRVKYLASDLTAEISGYKFSNPKWRNVSYEGHITLSVNSIENNVVRTFPAGTAVIDMNQRTAKIIAYLLEPKSNDSFLYWGFMNIIFEQKEYAETYVMEKMAREMIASNPELKAEFLKEKAENPAMKDHWTQTNWFYQRTPYYDAKHNIYPIGRIFDSSILKNIHFTENPK